jgi:hypothetical protein
VNQGETDSGNTIWDHSSVLARFDMLIPMSEQGGLERHVASRSVGFPDAIAQFRERKYLYKLPRELPRDALPVFSLCTV